MKDANTVAAEQHAQQQAIIDANEEWAVPMAIDILADTFNPQQYDTPEYRQQLELTIQAIIDDPMAYAISPEDLHADDWAELC